MRYTAKTGRGLQCGLWLYRRATELMCATALLFLALVLLNPDQRESISRIEFKDVASMPAAADVCRGCGVQAELSLDHFQFQIQFQIRIQPWAGLTFDYRISGRWSFGLLDWGRARTDFALPDRQWTVAGHFPDTQHFSVSCQHLQSQATNSGNVPESRAFRRFSADLSLSSVVSS